MKFRSDIEGLRAIAVILVILNHLSIPGFSGGYIGVDIFFVISGFLITSLLTHEYSENATKSVGLGRISLRAFYFRRANRILPVAFLVLIVTTVASYLIFNSVRAGTVARDAYGQRYLLPIFILWLMQQIIFNKVLVSLHCSTIGHLQWKSNIT